MTVDSTIRVKFLARSTRDADYGIWLRQFPGQTPVWGDCRFSFRQDDHEYDWLVVYDDLPARPGRRFSYRIEKLACPPGNTILVTTEPSTIRHYGGQFLRQFGHVITSQEPEIIDHPGAIYTQPGLRWFYGLGRQRLLTYDDMLADDVRTKTRNFSTVCSSKQQRHTTHVRRYEFTQYLAGRYPHMDLYGHGVQPVEDKAEAIRPYRYHLAIENHFGRHHITEKLTDVFLGGALPLYAGCPNADEYFPKGSFVAIDLSDFDRAVEQVIRTVESDEYEKRLPAILEARRRVLDEHNLFALLARHIMRLAGTATHADPAVRTYYLRSRRAVWMKRPDAWLESCYFKIKNRL